MHKKHEPIIWDNNKGELTDFYQVAKGLELNHIIYVSDSLGILNSVWATAEEDIVDCFYSFSDNYLFGRIQKIEDVLDDSFFDKLFNLN
jgi:hypothetical protein